MTKSLPLKNNQSSRQVLKTLQVLLQGDYTMKELIKILNKNEKEEIFNNSVISKYIATCRFAGIEIPKIQNIYYVAKMPFGLELTVNDVDFIGKIYSFIANNLSQNNVKVFDRFIRKIERFSNRDFIKISEKNINSTIEQFERAIDKKRKVALLFKNRDTMECIPIGITKVEGKTFLNVFYKKNRNIDINRLSGIEILGEKYIDTLDGSQVTIFKLTGPLAKRYTPYEHETIELNNNGEEVIVTNKYENKDVLFSRLMRYENYCEILKPKMYREEFTEFIKNTLDNYGIS